LHDVATCNGRVTRLAFTTVVDRLTRASRSRQPM
jgi:hypothetical protein